MWTIVRLLCAGTFILATAHAQGLPEGLITVVVPFAAGGSADAAMRLYADAFARDTGHTLVIENRPGGGGVVAAMAVKTARPDGRTLRLADIGPDAILPSMQALDYDPIKDFRQITLLFTWPQFLVVPANSPADSVTELIALGHKKPAGLSFGSQGPGSGGDLLGTMFETATGTPLVHVPYKGGGPLSLDLATGRVDLAFTSYREMRSAKGEGKIKFLAVASADRSPALPDVPSMAELGYASVELSPWFGLDAPARTPDATINVLHDALAKVATSPDVISRLKDDAIELKIGSPSEFAKFIRSETQRFRTVIKSPMHAD
jgi:tripartite-type tricarboxylate transporter receptor subunit TctC